MTSKRTATLLAGFLLMALAVLVAPASASDEISPPAAIPAAPELAVADDPCRRSEACKEDGECSLRDEECVATSDADCRASEWCEKAGYCTLRDDGCFAVTDDDCKASGACKLLGKCTVRRGSCAEE